MSALLLRCLCQSEGETRRQLSPQVEEFLQRLREGGRNRAVPADAVEEARRLYDEAARLLEGERVQVAAVEDAVVPRSGGAIPARLYRPKRDAAEPSPVVVFFHGGGWVLGNLESHDALCRRLAVASELPVLSVDYRLPPEAPFPAAVEDAEAAVSWLRERAPLAGLSREAVAVAGDSAGGTLAAVVARRLRDRGEPPLAMQILLYPVTQYEFSRRSFIDYGSGYYLTAADMSWFWHHYLADPTLASDPDVSPLSADNHAGLPPAIVVTAEFDPLHDQGVAYARRLAAAGVDVDLQCHRGMIHGFMRCFSVLDAAATAVEEVGNQVRQMLGQQQGRERR